MRTYRDAYVLWPALIAALVGYAMVIRREFWRDRAFSSSLPRTESSSFTRCTPSRSSGGWAGGTCR
jgi:hypothetical protein